MASCWLVKQEPSAYAFSQLVKDKATTWDGVRNAQARISLRAMKKGDRVLFYHSGDDKAVVGIARVTREAFPDPADAAWVAVELAAVRALARPVTLQEIKSDDALAGIALVKQSRLSVMPVDAAHFERIVELGAARAR